jgi:hypothetical protein
MELGMNKNAAVSINAILREPFAYWSPSQEGRRYRASGVLWRLTFQSKGFLEAFAQREGGDC